MIYRILFRLVLQYIPPEAAHTLAERTLAALGRVPGFRKLLYALVGHPDPRLTVRALGLTFPSPLGVAAGLDKNLTWFEELAGLGFGFVEVGSVTALPQPGNPRPRIHRLASEHALINRMGFPNRGAAAAAERLRTRSSHTVVGVNLGKSRAATDAAADYRQSVRQVAPWADIIVLNVSSPNTPGLRDIQAVDALSNLVAHVRSELERVGAHVPLLVKISPDLEDAQIDEIAELALRLRLDGLVAVNTTTSRRNLSAEAEALPGGLSGRPLKARALEVLRRLYAITDGQLVLVSVGGIESWRDVIDRIRGGATLVQAYTGFVYGGPLWPSRVNRGLSRYLRAEGVAAIQELVGVQAGTRTERAGTPAR